MTFRQDRKTRNSKTKDRERGVALIAALITLVLIAAITAGMIILSTTETSISANFRDEQTAFFAAKAGMEEVRDRLRNGATNSLRTGNLLPTTAPGTPNSVLYILNPANGEVVAPWDGSNLNTYPDTEICKETTTIACVNNLTTGQVLPGGAGWYTSTQASAVYAMAPVLPWKWARITLKQNNSIPQYATNGNPATPFTVCWNGVNEYADAAYTPATGCTSPNLPVYTITALAVTPTGTRRLVQTEVAEDRFPFSTPSPLLLNGPGASYAGPNGNNFQVDGHDQPGCGAPASNQVLDAIGVTNPGDVPGVINGIPPNRMSHYPGVNPSPDVANVSGNLPPNLQSVSDLQNLVSTIKNNVTQPVIN
ncbi:MAG TPA: PilX N-terminal domain-containing pilus assembly protein, partial [Candidatus Dormibacteraeota bacterium]|nr:PilX N-terminal domain-containing pilus assembly protein [Candidatus Dormibacteraeota bacterium]